MRSARRAGRIALVVAFALATPVVPRAAAAGRLPGRIVFSRLEADGYHLYSVRPDGNGLTQLTSGPGDDTEPDVSRDGRIVFSRGWGSVPRGPYLQLYIREPNGATHAVFASPSPTADYFPRWSPDGRRIVFTRASPGGELGGPVSADARIDLVNADGRGLRQLTAASRGSFATWSPDGRHIVFLAAAPEANPVLFTMDVARPAVVRRLTRKDGYQPSWSRDGRLIAFTAKRDAGTWQVYVIGSDGRHERRLTYSPGHDDKFPSWSPDGRDIVFESTRDNPCPGSTASAYCRPARLYLMRADGKRQRPITSGPADSYPVYARS
jgi:Tol biopolymer transport system component